MKPDPKIKNALVWISGILESKNIQYWVSGGFAAKIYGSPRPLNDIDIDIYEEDFPNILGDVSKYIKYGPKRYVDEKWDCYLITLNYLGQEIDICGARTTRITDKDNVTWMDLPSNLSNANFCIYENIKVPIIPRQDLIEYKKRLNGAHQIVDVNSICI